MIFASARFGELGIATVNPIAKIKMMKGVSKRVMKRGSNEAIRQRMIAMGLDLDAGIARRATLRVCDRCAGVTVVGLDDDLAAATARCDLVSLNSLGESLAILTGRKTWRLAHSQGRFELNYRESWHIQGEPAGEMQRGDIVPGHRCGTFWPPEYQTSNRLRSLKLADFLGEFLPENPPF